MNVTRRITKLRYPNDKMRGPWDRIGPDRGTAVKAERHIRCDPGSGIWGSWDRLDMIRGSGDRGIGPGGSILLVTFYDALQASDGAGLSGRGSRPGGDRGIGRPGGIGRPRH